METPATPPVEIVPISRLFCSPTNPRTNEPAVPHVAASIRRFGCQQLALLATGMTPAEIAKKVGCTVGLVYNVKSTNGAKGKRGPGRPPRIAAALESLK